MYCLSQQGKVPGQFVDQLFGTANPDAKILEFLFLRPLQPCQWIHRRSCSLGHIGKITTVNQNNRLVELLADESDFSLSAFRIGTGNSMIPDAPPALSTTSGPTVSGMCLRLFPWFRLHWQWRLRVNLHPWPWHISGFAYPYFLTPFRYSVIFLVLGFSMIQCLF